MDKLKLLAGLSDEIENICEIYPLTLRKIAKISESKYYQYLNILTIDSKHFIKEMGNNDILKDLSTFDILSVYCFNKEMLDLKKIIIDGLKLFFKEEDISFTVEKDIPFFYIGKLEDKRFITRDNYEIIKNILLNQNCYKKEEKEDEFNPANEAAAKLVERIKAMRKKRSDSDLTLFDLVSVLAANGNNLNILNIWDLTMFQFNDQFNRMQMIEDYEINIQSLLHGADSKKIELKHYIRKIK